MRKREGGQENKSGDDNAFLPGGWGQGLHKDTVLELVGGVSVGGASTRGNLDLYHVTLKRSSIVNIESADGAAVLRG